MRFQTFAKSMLDSELNLCSGQEHMVYVLPRESAPEPDPSLTDSEVDCGTSSEEEMLQAYVPPPKRQRVADRPHLDPGMAACIPSPAKASRLSRELGGAIFAMDFGLQRQKPQELLRRGRRNCFASFVSLSCEVRNEDVADATVFFLKLEEKQLQVGWLQGPSAAACNRRKGDRPLLLCGAASDAERHSKMAPCDRRVPSPWVCFWGPSNSKQSCFYWRVWDWHAYVSRGFFQHKFDFSFALLMQWSAWDWKWFNLVFLVRCIQLLHPNYFMYVWRIVQG